MFFINEDSAWENVLPGIKRKIVGHTEDLMAVHLCFDKGAIGAPHAHENS